MSEPLTLHEALDALRPYITHNIGCEWLTYMGVNRTGAQQRADCKCGFFNVVPPLLRRAEKSRPVMPSGTLRAQRRGTSG